MRAVGKIKQHIQDYSFCSEDPEQDSRTKNSVLRLASALPSGPEIFDETIMFQDPDTISLKEDFRNRFRNVSRIMDCVGCDKCRLWGKLQTNGYGTALKVLFEFDENDSSKDPPLRRTELVALINTMDRLSHSLQAIKEFRRMIDEREGIPKAVVPARQEHSQGVLKTKLALEKDQEPEIRYTDDGLPDFSRDWDASEMTVWEEMVAEYKLVMRVFRYVLSQWYHMPQKL
jgi:ERO1-like protein beta